jgi:hypothetical protein
MEPALVTCFVAPAVDVFVQDVNVISAEPLDFLLEAKPRVFHERLVAPVPEVTVPLNGAGYAVAHGFDHMLLHHFALRGR